MPLYSLESSNSAPRVANQRIAVDTSYLIALSDDKQDYYQPVVEFHTQAQALNAKFFINVVTRQEFIRQIRRVQFIEAIIALATANPTLEQEYRTVTGIANKDFDMVNLRNDYEKIYKYHVRTGSLATLLGALTKNVWEEVKELEAKANVNYVSAGGTYSWDDLGTLIAAKGIAPADGMIANFAFNIGASAIVTTDSDFAQITDLIDIYVPGQVADLCTAVYDPTND